MTNHIEIELRYQLLEVAQLKDFLVPFEKLHQKHDVDVYLDNQQAELYQRGIFVRIRNKKTLDIKFNRANLDDPNSAPLDYCEEHSFSLPLQDIDLIRLNTVLVSLDLKPLPIADLECLKSVNMFVDHYIVDKIRTSYKHGSFTLAVDEVAGLGFFLEVELMASDVENLAIVKQEMQELISALSVKPLETGYGTMLLRKNHFEYYVLGRYILEEDKAYKAQLLAHRGASIKKNIHSER